MSDQTTIKSQLIERAAERSKIWKQKAVREKPDPLKLKEWAILGTYAYSLQSSKIRIVDSGSLLEIGEGYKETPSTLARDYLFLSYGRSPKILHTQAEYITNKLQPMPLYSKPEKFEHGFYIDIKATFWSVLKVIGWNLDYYPSKWLSAGRAPDDFPFPDHKVARSCLVSVARPGRVQWFNPKGKSLTAKFPTRPAGSPIINLSISKLIADLCNSIAEDAIDLGAIYANTDGYIVTSERAAYKVCQMVFDYGLEPRIKAEGPGQVKDVGAYKVGNEESLPFEQARSHNFKKIQAPHYKKWLRDSFSRWSAFKTAT